MRLSDNDPGASLSGWGQLRLRVDWVLVGFAMLLMAVALVNLFGATAGTEKASKFYLQIVWVLVGVSVFVIMTLVDYQRLLRFAWWALVGITIAIALLPFMADVVKGSERWLQLGPVRVQPSEIAKPVAILALARLSQEVDQGHLTRHGLIARVGLLIVLIVLIAMQPDLGTAAMVGLSLATVALLMLRNLKPVVGLIMVAAVAVPIMWQVSETFRYQKQRVEALVAADESDTEKGWQSSQSKIAIGSGGWTGKGLGNGTQSKYGWLAEYWTDFPFSEWAEQTGFFLSAMVIVAYALFALWLLSAGVRSRDRAGTVICFGAAAMVFWHSAVNLGMGLGVAPVVGLTLPLFSYGGSSLMSFMLILGLASSVRLRQHGFGVGDRK